MQTPSPLAAEAAKEPMPDHTQLPDEDGSIVENFQEHPQSTLLTGSLLPRLCELHPDGQFCIGCDSGIYWKHTTPPLDGCKAPDWFYVPGVPPMLDGKVRRSYVLWKEGVRPLLLIEYVSGDGSVERDKTPCTGKFWVYERGICAPYYAIYEVAKASVELFRLNGGSYEPVAANPAGRLLVPPLNVELGIWQGTYERQELPWLRVWDAQTGTLLSSTEEREQIEKQRANGEKQRADTAEGLLDDTRQLLQEECERAENERKRAKALAEKLRAMGVDPDAA